MARSCALVPKVRNSKGELRDSNLFKELRDMTAPNRKAAVRLWGITRLNEFKNAIGDKLSYDENGEPTMASLMKNTSLSDYISQTTLVNKLNRRFNFTDSDGNPITRKDTIKNRRELIDKAVHFNENNEYSDYCVATMDKIDKENGDSPIAVTVKNKTSENAMTAAKMGYNANLNKKLIDILKQNGIDVGVLNDVEERMGIHGIADFDVAKATAEGLIEAIRISNDIEGQMALPEEFSHLAIRGMQDNPLVSRLLGLIQNNNLAENILGDEYDSYFTAYRGDQKLLTEEAAGKLLAKHLFQNETMPANQPYNSILRRLINAVKGFFRQFDPNEIRRAMTDAELGFDNLAKEILNSDMAGKIKFRDINEGGKLYNLVNTADRDTELARKIIGTELHRALMYTSKSKKGKISEKQEALIGVLEQSIIDHQEIESVFLYVSNAAGVLAELDERIKKLNDDAGMSMNEKAKLLVQTRDYLFSYWGIFKEIKEVLLAEKREGGNWFKGKNYGAMIEPLLNQLNIAMDDMYYNWTNAAYPLFIDFMKQFMGNDLVVPFGEHKGETISVETLVKTAEQDISIVDRWLDSMSNSSDYMLRLFDQAIKKSKNQSRLRAIEMEKTIKQAGIRLEQAGVKNQDWMFERDEDGNLTGNYISRIDLGKYQRAREAEEKRLDGIYGKNPVGVEKARKEREMKSWIHNNREWVDGKSRPKASLYSNPAYDRMTTAQREFYDKMMEIKAICDGFLPENATTLESAVKIRKDLVERLKDSDTVKKGVRHLWEAIKDAWIVRSDNEDFGIKSTLVDFENRRMHLLPIYYTKMHENESMQDLSTDVVSTMIAYASMAIDYDEMNKVIDILEVGRDLMQEREIKQTEGGKTLMEKATVLGRKFERVVRKKGETSNFMGRLEAAFEMQICGRYMKDETVLGTNFSWGKTANDINAAVALNTYAINLLSGISNVETGKVMMRIESFAGEFFSESDTLWADKEYALACKDYIGDIGSRVQTSKLALWLEKFDVLQDYEEKLRDVDWDKRTRLGRLFQMDMLYFMNNVGEHWMQTRTTLALAHRVKMRGPNGEICSLWDAMDVQWLNPDNHREGARLVLKEGYTKEDGTAWTADDEYRFTRKCARINQKMHGIYNRLDMSAAQAYGIGRLAFMYRKWMVPAYERRFSNVQYDFELDSWTEGFYRTTGRFTWQAIKDIRHAQFIMASRWEELHPTEKANIIRALTELGHFAVIALAALAFGANGDDRKYRPWWLRMVEYQVMRLRTEIGVLTPMPWEIIPEMLTILRTPAAAVTYANTVLGLVQCLNLWNWEYFGGDDALVESGKYKGYSKGQRALFRALPFANTLYRAIHPDESVQFYNQWNI